MAEMMVLGDDGSIRPWVCATSAGNVKPDFFFRASLNSAVSQGIMGDVAVHGILLDKATQSTQHAVPICYMRASAGAPPAAGSSLDTPINLLAEQYYKNVRERLVELRSFSDSGDEVVERGAVDTALNVLTKLHDHHLAPPEISHHGGDAVVMLWTLGSSTYAITVTEGEVGWVVRRDRREINSEDSIKVDNFRLLDFR